MIIFSSDLFFFFSFQKINSSSRAFILCKTQKKKKEMHQLVKKHIQHDAVRRTLRGW
jgi:hypothetical protein